MHAHTTANANAQAPQNKNTLTDDGWTDANTQVVCRSLGCSPDGGTAVTGGDGYGKAFGGGSQIWMDNVACSGSESDLSACSFKGYSCPRTRTHTHAHAHTHMMHARA